MARVGARDATFVDYKCDNRGCGTWDFAGVAPILSLMVIILGFWLLFPPGRKPFTAPATIAFYAVFNIIGLTEALSAGYMTLDGDAHLPPPFSASPRVMLVVYGGLTLIALVIAAVMWTIRRGRPSASVPPPVPAVETSPAAETAPAASTDGPAKTAELIAHLAQMRANGEMSEEAFAIAMAELRESGT